MSEENIYTNLVEEVRAEFPRFSEKERDKSWLMPIFWVLSKITRQNYDTFTTTVFSTMYVGPSWKKKSPKQKYKTLRHERVHIDQFHNFPMPRWLWPINHLLMAFCYLLVLPVFLTMRARFERAGYTQSMLAEFELYGPFSDSKMEDWGRWMAETFGGGAYLYMGNGSKAYAWAMDTMRKINSGELIHHQGKAVSVVAGDDSQDPRRSA